MGGASVELTSSTSFNLTNGELLYELQAKTMEDTKDWVAHLNAAIAEVKKTPLYIYLQVH